MVLNGGLFRRYPRLVLAVVLGSGVGIFLPEHGKLVTHLLAGWNTTVWLYLVLMAQLIKQTTPAQVKSIAEQEDGNGAVFTTVLTVAAVLSLVAIIFELAAAKDLTGESKYFHYAFTFSIPWSSHRNRTDLIHRSIR